MSGRLTGIKKDYCGTVLPTNVHGQAGVAFEAVLKQDGFEISSNATGPDIERFGAEVKTRKIGSTSAQTIGRLSASNIKTTPFEFTSICKKIQQQIRAKTDDSVYIGNTIVECSVYDFSSKHIQDLLKEAYEVCRNKLIAGDTSNYIHGTKWGFLERENEKKAYQFRISASAFSQLERMAKAAKNYNKFFE